MLWQRPWMAKKPLRAHRPEPMAADEHMTPPGILETVLYCQDLEAAEAFYTRVLGLEVHLRQPGRHVFFKCGTGMLLLFNPDATQIDDAVVNGARILPHGARGVGHMAFRDTAERLRIWEEHLAAHGVAIESDVRWPNGARSIYFSDPAGNCLEIATPDLWGFPA